MESEKFVCPCCGCRTLDEQGEYDICPVCYWEDDGDHDETSENGANKGLTLVQARENFVRCGAFDSEFSHKTRKPFESEITDTYTNLTALSPPKIKAKTNSKIKTRKRTYKNRKSD